MTASLDLQSALYSLLTSDTELVSLVTGVFDALPDNTQFPYVVIGESTEVPANTLSTIGRECTATVHVFSRYPGMKETKEIAGRIISLIDRQHISASGIGIASSTLDLAQFFIDPDDTRHGVLRFRFVVR